MSTGKQAFKLTEAARLIKAARAANLKIKRITTDCDGRPVLITDQESDGDSAGEQSKNPLDRVLDNAAKRPA